VNRFNDESRSPDQSIVMRRVEAEVRLRISGVLGQAQAHSPRSSSEEQGQQLGLKHSSQAKRMKLLLRRITALSHPALLASI